MSSESRGGWEKELRKLVGRRDQDDPTRTVRKPRRGDDGLDDCGPNTAKQKLVGGGKSSSVSDTSIKSRVATYRRPLSVSRIERAGISSDSGMASSGGRVKRNKKPPSLSPRSKHSRSSDGSPN